jgi:hypothetical protein
LIFCSSKRFLILASAWRFVPSHVRSSTSHTVNITTLCTDVCLSGILSLSIAPHQEPRFLLPLVFPLCVLVATSFSKPPLVRTLEY